MLPTLNSSFEIGGGHAPVGRQQYRCAAYFADPIVRDDPMMGRVLFDLSYVPAPDDRTPKSGPWDFG